MKRSQSGLYLAIHPEDHNRNVSDHFLAREFRGPGQDQDMIYIDMSLVARLEAIRRTIDKPMRITSGIRTVSYNAALKRRNSNAASYSQHIYCNAADVAVPGEMSARLEMCAHAIAAGFCAVETYPDQAAVHMDTRRGIDDNPHLMEETTHWKVLAESKKYQKSVYKKALDLRAETEAYQVLTRDGNLEDRVNACLEFLSDEMQESFRV